MKSLVMMLYEIGIDITGTLRRLGENEQLYLIILRKFLIDENYKNFVLSIEIKDYKTATVCIHTLKGVAVNLGFVKLATICDSIFQDLILQKRTHLVKETSCLKEEYDKIVGILINL